MALKPLFVSASTIKKYGVLENNVDDKLISQKAKPEPPQKKK